MNGERTIVLGENDRVNIRGMDYESRKLTLHHKTTFHSSPNYIVIKVHGGSVWDGNYCPRRYVPAYFEVYQIVSQKGNEIQAQNVFEFPLKRLKLLW